MNILHRPKPKELEKPADLPPSPAEAMPSRVRHVLDTALGQSHEVKAEVQACAKDLGSANELAKAHIADGASMLPAAQALQNGLAVEQRVQGCADDLQQLADNLSAGVDEVQAVRR